MTFVFLLGKVLKPVVDFCAVFNRGQLSLANYSSISISWKARASCFPGNLALADMRQVGLPSLRAVTWALQVADVLHLRVGSL